MGHRVLIVEDDVFVLELLGTCMRQAGYDVSLATTGKDMHDILTRLSIDIILLDLTLPDEDGLALVRRLRARSSLPIIVLTSRTGREDRLAALELGVDDFVTKPCDTEELLLRVRNLITRSQSSSGSSGMDMVSNIHEFDGWELNVSAGSLTDPTGIDVPLPLSEFNLLTALVRAPGRILSRGFLLDAINQGDDGASDRMVDVLISRLRKKLGDNPRKPLKIVTVSGRGYKFMSQK